MKQKELKKKINEFMTMLNDNGYSSHIVIVKDKQLECLVASGDLEDVVNGFVQMFADAMTADAPRELKMTCSALADIVRQYQQIALDSSLGLNDDDDEDCENCDKLHTCMNSAAIEKRKELGLKSKNVNVN